MSFSSDVKHELATIENFSACYSKAQVYGLVLFAKFSPYDISLSTENRDVVDLYISSVNELCGCEPVITGSGSKKMLVSVESNDARIKIYKAFDHGIKDTTTRINHANFEDESCYGAFLRGAFLSCGTVTDPEKNYHLEFVVSHKRLCLDMMKVMEEAELHPKYIMRKGNHIIYFKDSESIEDILTVMGATNSSLAIMGIKMEKDIKNKVNRKLNFEMSNINKTINAASRQIDAIQKIANNGGIISLPENLREVAALRLENPDISLKELGALMSEPISRSGVNHRLSRIVEIADKL